VKELFELNKGDNAVLFGKEICDIIDADSPQAGQNIFADVALGEYFRSFVAYGTIAFALVLNIREAELNPASLTAKTRQK